MMQHMVFCPVCKRRHPFNIMSDDFDDFNCTDNATSKIKKQDYDNFPQENVNGWNFNGFNRLTEGYTNDSKLVDLRLINPHPRNVRNW